MNYGYSQQFRAPAQGTIPMQGVYSEDNPYSTLKKKQPNAMQILQGLRQAGIIKADSWLGKALSNNFGTTPGATPPPPGVSATPLMDAAPMAATASAANMAAFQSAAPAMSAGAGAVSQ
jgi:hypothetical protein